MSDIENEKAMDSPTVQEQDEKHHRGDQADVEAVGTIILDENETGRKTLRPRPSLDINDPLVRNSAP